MILNKGTLVLLAVVAIISGAAGFSFHFYQNFVLKPAGNSAQEIIFEVEPGQSFMSVSERLEKMGVVKNKKLFYLYARLKGKSVALKQGEYAVYTKMKPAEVLDVITSGKSIGRKFTIVEGSNIFELATLFEQSKLGTRKEFLSWVKNQELIKELLGYPAISLEGYLYPETYSFNKFMSTPQMIKLMVQTFQNHFQDIEAEMISQNMTKHQIVTLASIIEKETGAVHERELISSVFHNRLKKNMLLQTDPTILYGLADENGEMLMKISKADIHRPTRYNTYVIKGLPPGPIANPGFDALKAALSPAQSEYLFFVSQNDGTHVFSTNYENHNSAVKKHQLDPKARKGKSWRDLKKKDQKQK